MERVWPGGGAWRGLRGRGLAQGRVVPVEEAAAALEVPQGLRQRQLREEAVAQRQEDALGAGAGGTRGTRGRGRGVPGEWSLGGHGDTLGVRGEGLGSEEGDLRGGSGHIEGPRGGVGDMGGGFWGGWGHFGGPGGHGGHIEGPKGVFGDMGRRSQGGLRSHWGSQGVLGPKEVGLRGSWGHFGGPEGVEVTLEVPGRELESGEGGPGRDMGSLWGSWGRLGTLWGSRRVGWGYGRVIPTGTRGHFGVPGGTRGEFGVLGGFWGPGRGVPGREGHRRGSQR